MQIRKKENRDVYKFLILVIFNRGFRMAWKSMPSYFNHQGRKHSKMDCCIQKILR